MSLSEAEFAAIIEGGCACGHGELMVQAVVLQKIELYRGEQLGQPSWGYKGEDLVRGTFAITCTRCKGSLYEDDACSLCGAAGGLARMQETESVMAMGERCPGCGGDKLTVEAYVAAKVVHGNGRAQRARSNTAPEDEGFHVRRVSCKACFERTTHRGGCVLCGA